MYHLFLSVYVYAWLVEIAHDDRFIDIARKHSYGILWTSSISATAILVLKFINTILG